MFFTTASRKIHDKGSEAPESQRIGVDWHRLGSLTIEGLRFLRSLRAKAMSLKIRYVKDLVRRAVHYRMLLVATILTNITAMALAFVFPWLVGAAIDDVIVPGKADPASVDERVKRLIFLIIVGAITAVLTGIVIYVRGNCTTKLGNRVIADLRVDLFDHLQRLSLHFYSKERIGALVSCLINDIQQATNLINSGMLMIAVDMIQATAAIGMLVAISWKLTLASIGILPLYLMTFYIFSDRVRIATDNVLQQLGQISGDVQERLAGIAVVKANVGEERERKRFEEATEKYFNFVVEQSNMTNLTVAASEIVLLLGTVIIIGYGSWLALRPASHLTAGDLTRFLAYVAIMYGPLRRFAELNNVYQSSVAALTRIYGIFYITPEISERRSARKNTQPMNGDVHFNAVKFRYQNTGNGLRLDGHKPDAPESDECKKWVLDGLEFSVKARECVALVGPSGSGKSTVVSLLPRLYDVTEGSICIDNIDVRDFRLGHLRNSIAIVQQDSFLFTGTVRDNLRYGRPGATDQEIVAAATAANAHEFISKLPQGYDSRVGERGVNLSGGQRQRLSIARAILKNPRILILDEATSALDTESEALIQAALENLMKDRTSFIVAHRLSTVRNADRILVIDQGRIVESGSHQSLLDQNGLYARMARESAGNVEAVPVAATG